MAAFTSRSTVPGRHVRRHCPADRFPRSARGHAPPVTGPGVRLRRYAARLMGATAQERPLDRVAAVCCRPISGTALCRRAYASRRRPDRLAAPYAVAMHTEPRPPLIKRLRPAHWLILDCLIATGYAAIAGAVLSRHPSGTPMALGLAAVAVLSLAMGLRRRQPVLALAVVLVVLVTLDVPYQSLLPAWSALYLVAVTGRRRTALAALGAVAHRAGAGGGGFRPRRAARPDVRPGLDRRLRGRAAPGLRAGAAAAPSPAGRGRAGAGPPRRHRGADAHRPGAARRRRAQHERDHGAGRFRPPRDRRSAGQGPGRARRHRDHRPGSARPRCAGCSACCATTGPRRRRLHSGARSRRARPLWWPRPRRPASGSSSRSPACPGRCRRDRPVGVPDRAGGAHQRGQARRDRRAAGSASPTRSTSCPSRSPTTAAARPAVNGPATA